MKSKINAGHYAVTSQIGRYTVRNDGSRNWVMTTANGQRVGKFPSLAEATAWLESLDRAPASITSKNYLRNLIAANPGEVAEGERAHFNALRAKGALISQNDVSRAIRGLTGRGSFKGLPRQRRVTSEAVLPKAEAIRQARAALRVGR